MFSETAQRAALSDTQDKKAAPHRAYVYVACTVLAIAWNYVAGKEMAWDLLHYHFYAGFSALNDRFDQDYFAAGPQSYFNPYAYVPFYVLVRLGLPALMVGTILAVIHSVVLWITYELACSVCPSEDPKTRLFFGSCATALAFLNSVLLQQIGSSFADITTTGLVLGGWLLLVRAVRRPSTKRVILGAVLLGLATALKPTNGVHALAGFFLVAFVPAPLLGRIFNLCYFGAALGTSFVLTAAPWSYRLVRMFGNPMFPLLNNIFQSPDFTTASLKHYRFIPDSLIDALLRPFAMMGASGMIDVELPAPDIRYALLLSAFLLLIIAPAWRSIRGTATPVAAPHSEPETRALIALGCGFTAAWIVWLSGSGNGRYFIPMACVAAVLAVAILFRLLANHSVGRNSLLLTLLVAQGAQLVLSGDHRWSKAPWGAHWFNVDIPEKLVSQPNLYLTIGMQSNSFITPFLAKGSGLVNFSGGYVLGPDGANALRVRTLISRNTPRLRVLVSGDRIYKDAELREPRQSDVDDALRIFGLRVDMSDCETITVQGSPASVWRPLESSIPGVIVPRKLRYTSHLVSCHLVVDTRDESREAEARRAADIVLDRLEDACPALFQPRRPQTEHINQMWLRVYPSTDLSAWVGNGEVKFIDPTRGVRHGIVVGREEEWARDAQSLECGRRHGIYFARLTQVGK
jgi:hypothetical protein